MGLKKKLLSDRSDYPIGLPNLGSNKINTDLLTNQRAVGGRELTNSRAYFRQYFQLRRRGRLETEAETGNTTEELLLFNGLFGRFSEIYSLEIHYFLLVVIICFGSTDSFVFDS